MSTMLRSAVTLLACLAISSASAAELTCKQWFEYGHRSHLPHGKSERMAEIRAAVTATFDTIEVMRADLAKLGGQTEPSPHNVIESRTRSFPRASVNKIGRCGTCLLQCVRRPSVLSLLPIRLRLSHEFCPHARAHDCDGSLGRSHLSQVTEALVGLCLRRMLEPRQHSSADRAAIGHAPQSLSPRWMRKMRPLILPRIVFIAGHQHHERLECMRDADRAD